LIKIHSFFSLQMEGLSEVTKSYSPLSAPFDPPADSDPSVPPFWKISVPSTLHLTVYLDTVRPLSEPKWAKTGDIQDWLKSILGRMFWAAGDAAEGWEQKIQVVDPDPVCLKSFSSSFGSDAIVVATDHLDGSRRLVY
jgi:20S proteasome subunit alpha 6